MPGETDLHKTLKKEACHWLFRSGYACVAAEVRLPPLGIIDAVGSGMFPSSANHLGLRRQMHQVCFVEAKASRADFLADFDNEGQMLFQLRQRRDELKGGRRRPRRATQIGGLGKFKLCLLRPLANLHYIIAPAGLIQKKDLPPRWGLLSCAPGSVSVVVRAQWMECDGGACVESAIARTLTGDLYRADARAMNSINRQIMAEQQAIAAKLRELRPQVVLAPGPDERSVSE